MSDRDILKALFDDQPFFAGATHGVQSLPRRGLLLTALVSLVSDRPVRVLEVGSWIGFSALTWAYAIDRFCPPGGSVLCVDPWSPYLPDSDLQSRDETYSRMDRLARTGLAFELFRHNTMTGPDRVPIRFSRGSGAAVLPTLEAGSFDIVYVDGDHSHEAARADIIAGRRLVAEGGLLVGDDLEMQIGPALSETEVRASLGRDIVRLENGGAYHPGVTLAVAESFGPVSMLAGTWFMQRIGAEFRPINDLSGARMMIPRHWPDDFATEAKRIARASESR